MIRNHPAVVNILIGVVIGLCIAFVFLPNDSATRWQRVGGATENANEHKDHHDAHEEHEVDDENAPAEAMHFHAGGGNNGSSAHHHGM